MEIIPTPSGKTYKLTEYIWLHWFKRGQRIMYLWGLDEGIVETPWFHFAWNRPHTSFCDLAFGFNGAIYRATNFELFRITDGRPTNPGGKHGKWGSNDYEQTAQKAFYVYHYH